MRMFDQFFTSVWIVALGVSVCLLYFFLSNILLDLALPSEGKLASKAIRNIGLKSTIRPWLFVGPAFLLLSLYLVFPVLQTIWLSFHDKFGDKYVGLSNYTWAFNDVQFRQSIYNNLLWLLVVPAASTIFGVIIAALTDRLKWGTLAKSLIFVPMAISFVGASVIWKFVYDYRAEGQDQIGILNAIFTSFGFEPQVWISLPFWNNFFLMAILIWIQTGFATVIFAAALRGVPEDTIEAATLDGAGPLKIFMRIIVPQIWSTIIVVWTTITVLVLKVFDIVLTMTNGQWDSQVLANLMFDWMFRGGGDSGRGAAIAIVLMLAVLPIMIWNIRQANKEQGGGH
jgi:alpha-glucoside transport system permease protein